MTRSPPPKDYRQCYSSKLDKQCLRFPSIPSEGRWPPSALCGGVEKYRGSGVSLENYQWIFPSFCDSTSGLSSVNKLFHASVSAGTHQSCGRGSGIASQQGSDRGSSGVGTGLLQPPILRTQTRWEVASHPKSEEVEFQSSRGSSLSNGYDSGRRAPHSPERLCRVGGFKRCLLSNTNKSPSSPVSSIWVEKETLSVPRPPLRPFSRSPHLYSGDKTLESVSTSKENQTHNLSRRYIDSGCDGGRMSQQRRRASSSSSSTGIHSQLSEVVPIPVAEIPLPRPRLGHESRSDWNRRDKTSCHRNKSFDDLEESTTALQRSPTAFGAYDGREFSGTFTPPPQPLSSKRSEQSLRDSEGSGTPRQSVDRIVEGSDLDVLFGASPMRETDVAPPDGVVQRGSVNGRLGLCLGDLLRGTSPPRQMDGCGCPSPYQCEGTKHIENIPHGLPSPVQERMRASMEDRFINISGLHQEGRGDCFSDIDGSGAGNSSHPPSSEYQNPSSFCQVGGESPRGCGIAIHRSPGLAPPIVDFQQNFRPLVETTDRPVCNNGIDSPASLLCLGQRRGSRSVRRPSAVLGLPPRLRVSSSSSPSTSHRQNRRVDGLLHSHHSLLASSEMVSSDSDVEGGGGTSTAGGAAGSRFEDGRAASSDPSSSLMEDYRRLRSFNISEAAFGLIRDSWRVSSRKRYATAWSRFKEFIASRNVPLNSVDLSSVIEYISHLNDEGLAYRTINLHRSVLSAMLPNFDGYSIGKHPTIARVVKGVFQRRPPQRRLFESWDVGKVFKTFASPSSSSFADNLREVAFLIAMASARRPSELFFLRCSSNHMKISPQNVRFIPSQLSKTDRQTHLGPAIIIQRLPETDDNSICPVAALERLLEKRRDLNIEHDFIFSSVNPPHPPLTVAGFSDLIRDSFRRADIAAPPGSTRSISVSDAFARGASVGDVLLAGDWTCARTFFRHYCRTSGSV